MIVDGPPAFFGTDAESRSDGVDAVPGMAGCFLQAAVVLWAWTVHLEASEPEEGYRSRIDSAAGAARKEGRQGARAGKADRKSGGAAG
ncbi:hypothetical protein [Streptomyces katrae]|uniref:hypothetical protein n=1 Tax=Streptomyces katrae TaxID=68223 RepID=UPI00131D25ED|nr:hypothetical protein [Streptomyces katrae]